MLTVFGGLNLFGVSPNCPPARMQRFRGTGLDTDRQTCYAGAMRVASVGVPTIGGATSRWKELADVRVELATPMLGGGSRAGHPDADQPFRPSAVRGALRRWWRATNVFSSPADLRERERELWGMADRDQKEPVSSRVRIEVDQVSAGDHVILREAQGLVPDYARGILIEPRTGSRAVPDAVAMRVLRTGSFRVRVCLRTFGREEGDPWGQWEAEIRRALAAWLLFGGIGARTRRGFGSLKWTGFDAVAALIGLGDEKGKWDRLTDEQRKEFLKSGFTSLIGARLFLKDAASPNAAWHDAIGTFRDFRKGQRGRQRPGLGPDSHSPWPEADSIRQAQGVAPLRPIPYQTFPRAELGLPLQFRSARPGRQNDNRPVAGEFGESWVPTTTGQTRLASPVLVKPIFWDGRWKAGFVLLKRERLDRRGLLTDAKGYPDNVYGVPQYAGRIQPANDILEVLNVMLKHPAFYGYTAVPLP